MTKEDLQNRIEQVAYDGATDGCNQAIIEREAEKLATEIVKFFDIVNLRKLFVAFANFKNNQNDKQIVIFNDDIDSFLNNPEINIKT
jgi:hypothetical protein